MQSTQYFASDNSSACPNVTSHYTTPHSCLPPQFSSPPVSGKDKVADAGGKILKKVEVRLLALICAEVLRQAHEGDQLKLPLHNVDGDCL